ncbi:AI-2E family transporter [Brevibacterium album]|uniref:AI-2E family transporter n=1 Tax=Brevibacterium album TaxID=417948 RepID=UPI000406550B|nr:AI-2E family transporter [Brevibacterium album]
MSAAGAGASPSATAPPPALPRFATVTLGLAGLAVVMVVFRQLQDIVAPVFLALNLVIIVHPLQALLVRAKVPRFLAAMATVLIVLVVLAAFFALAAWSIAELVLIMPGYAGEVVAIVQDTGQWLETLGLTPGVLQQQLAALDASRVISTLAPLFSNATLVLTLLVTVVMAVFFVALDTMSFPQRLASLGRERPGFAEAMTSFAAGVRRYWVVATVFGLIVAVLDVVALEVIGVPLALVWGVLAFLTNYIPNVGFVIGLVPPALLALVDQGWAAAVWVVVAYCVLNFVIQSIIQPKFTGESVGVTPLVSFLSLLFWYWVLGWLGALLALPATLLIKALLVDADPRARWINSLIASDLRTGASLPVAGVPGGGRREARRGREIVVALDGTPEGEGTRMGA